MGFLNSQPPHFTMTKVMKFLLPLLLFDYAIATDGKFTPKTDFQDPDCFDASNLIGNKILENS